ncbi:Rieske (2Fe-2S) protein [Mycobacterium sp. PS03-16]|uniref:Rieske (2Fe-2S) protein n=1 Tax=Mycobacterium sp. PS03-16 TaxID=2559611 RepID=UPI001074461A|nr:Rieske (2Fe-2S) protein [Mycobacterium sp. PS03-16]TFV55737.1 Rieske (2Fe-2S) protein [Mycobacterium sp. PS03-16]
MFRLRNEPHERGVDTGSPFPPVTADNPAVAEGALLIRVDDLDERGVREVRTARHGVLAVGVTPDGTPFAVDNICRHQFAHLGRGRVTPQGCLECPWHRARYDVRDGTMLEGPKGRIFGFRPYSAMVRLIGRTVTLRSFPVHLRDGAIYLDETA